MTLPGIWAALRARLERDEQHALPTPAMTTDRFTLPLAAPTGPSRGNLRLVAVMEESVDRMGREPSRS